MSEPVPGLELVPVSGLLTAPDDSARFGAWVEVLARVAHEDLGADHDAWTAEELRALEAGTSTRRSQALALLDGSPVGAAGVIAPTLDNRRTAQVSVAVLPGRRTRGVGTALLDWAEGRARALERTTLHAVTDWAGGLEDDPDGRWSSRHGYSPAQTTLRSDLAVPQAGVEVAADPPGYRIECHRGPVPERDLEDRAFLLRRMSTDVPLGDLELEEEAWDTGRVRGEDERAVEMGRRVLASYARDLGSGRLVGFTTIQAPRDPPTLAYQHDTLVVREHRGHGLGLAMKVANLAGLAEALPAVRTVRTWNAVENVHMLAVNATMGFEPTGYQREWQKHLD